MNPTHSERLYRALHIINDHWRTSLIAFAIIIALTTGAVTTVLAGGPPVITETRSVSVVESSRDINEEPRAVVQMPNGERAFIKGIYTAGDAATIHLTADGSIVDHGAIGIYWILITAVSVIFGLLSLLFSMFTLTWLDEHLHKHPMRHRARLYV